MTRYDELCFPPRFFAYTFHEVNRNDFGSTVPILLVSFFPFISGYSWWQTAGSIRGLHVCKVSSGPKRAEELLASIFHILHSFSCWNYIFTNCYTTWTKIFGILTLREFCWGQIFETYKLPMSKAARCWPSKTNGGQSSIVGNGAIVVAPGWY